MILSKTKDAFLVASNLIRIVCLQYCICTLIMSQFWPQKRQKRYYSLTAIAGKKESLDLDHCVKTKSYLKSNRGYDCSEITCGF